MEECGCVTIRENNISRIKFCPLHARAATLRAENEALRAALKVSLPVLETEYYLIDEETSPEYAKKVNLAYESARAALAKGGE